MHIRKHDWRERLFAYFSYHHGRSLLVSEIEDLALAVDDGTETAKKHLEEEHGVELTDEDIIAIMNCIY